MRAPTRSCGEDRSQASGSHGVLLRYAPGHVEVCGAAFKRTRFPLARRVRFEDMLIYSMSVSVDGFIADRNGGFGWTAPEEELFRFHLAQVRASEGRLQPYPRQRPRQCSARRGVGGGTPFLPPVTEDVPLEPIETRTFGSRVIYERYRRDRREMD